MTRLAAPPPFLPLPQLHEYRLRDKNLTLGGSTAVPPVTTLPPKWQITPTVSSGLYTFNGPGQALLMVYDVWGRTVWQGTASSQRMDLSALPAGLYLVHVRWEEKQQTFRVVKQ